MTPANLILASASPRRSDCLKKLGLDFTVCPANICEALLPDELAPESVVRLSRDKAAKIQEEYPEAIVIGGDTVVSMDDEVLGKPSDEKHAVEMLLCLSGQTHTVFSGLAVAMPSGEIVSDFSSTQVRFRTFGRKFAQSYVATREPMDKAGAYAIQGKGASLVKNYEGSYSNIVGLPIDALKDLLQKSGFPLDSSS